MLSTTTRTSEEDIRQQFEILKNKIKNDRKNNGGAISRDTLNEIFSLFDFNRDDYLDESEFSQLLEYVITCKQDDTHERQVKEIFSLLDIDNDGKISLKEFLLSGKYWLKQIFNPVTALIIVDVQNDFIDGTLSLKNCPSLHDGSEVVPIINHLLDTCDFDLVVYSYDWHPQNHISFFENRYDRKFDSSSPVTLEDAKVFDKVIFAGPPKTEQVLWPAHCVQKSWGAELHKDLKVVENSVCVYKGVNSEFDSYSAFWDNGKVSQTNLASELDKRKVTDVYVCGLATDVCVGATSCHAIEHGFRTVIIDDASRGVDHDEIKVTHKKLECDGAIVVNSRQIQNMVNVDERHLILAVKAAKNVSEGFKLAKTMTENKT